MSSLARRSMRTAAATAGIAALGVGFAGTAFAAPELPATPSTDDLDAASLPSDHDVDAHFLGEKPSDPSSASDLNDLPPAFTFEPPNVNTASPSESPADELATVEGDVQDLDEQVNTDADSRQNRVGPVGGVEDVESFAATGESIAQDAMAGGSLTENQNIGD